MYMSITFTLISKGPFVYPAKLDVAVTSLFFIGTKLGANDMS